MTFRLFPLEDGLSAGGAAAEGPEGSSAAGGLVSAGGANSRASGPASVPKLVS